MFLKHERSLRRLAEPLGRPFDGLGFNVLVKGHAIECGCYARICGLLSSAVEARRAKVNIKRLPLRRWRSGVRDCLRQSWPGEVSRSAARFTFGLSIRVFYIHLVARLEKNAAVDGPQYLEFQMYLAVAKLLLADGASR